VASRWQFRLAAVIVAALLGTFLALRDRPVAPPEPLVIPDSGPLTIALTGDTVLSRPVAPSDRDGAFDAVVQLVRGATVALTNLETTLLGEANAARAREIAGARWPFGTGEVAGELAALGLDVVGLANDHAADYGADGIADTSATLLANGLLPAGTGHDLAEARQAVTVGGRRKVAVLAVAISAPPESMATAARGNVNGRPGVNPLRYVADVTVDAQTYETLRRSQALAGGSEASGDRVTLPGATIRKGTTTSLSLEPDAADVEAILAQVARARMEAEVVVLSVHSHEPSNESDEPAELFSRFARQAIDAGAHMVVGHGPHRLRGVEVYKGGAILYSVGTFLHRVQDREGQLVSPFDAGFDMYSLAMGMPARTGGGISADDALRDGLVVVATFDQGALQTLRLHPVDLGLELPPAQRGVPRQPSSVRAAALLEHVARLSQPYGTTVRISDGVGAVDVK
jgi:poly-gamma-glutamate synthesis protein (capsule biosynthesis protein)